MKRRAERRAMLRAQRVTKPEAARRAAFLGHVRWFLDEMRADPVPGIRIETHFGLPLDPSVALRVSDPGAA